MRKLVLIGLFLGSILHVYAGFYFQIDQVNSEISIIGSVEEDIYLLFFVDGEISNAQLGPAAPSMSDYFADGREFVEYLGYGLESGANGQAWAIASSPAEVYKTGTYMTFQYGPGTMNAALYSYNELTGTLSWLGGPYLESNWRPVILPEPATLGILGLGFCMVRIRGKRKLTD